MSICCCSLAGSAACMRCQQNPMSAFTHTLPPQYWPHPVPETNPPGTQPQIMPWFYIPEQPKVLPVPEKIIEEYDKDGKLVKRTIIRGGENEDKNV